MIPSTAPKQLTPCLYGLSYNLIGSLSFNIKLIHTAIVLK